MGPIEELLGILEREKPRPLNTKDLALALRAVLNELETLKSEGLDVMALASSDSGRPQSAILPLPVKKYGDAAELLKARNQRSMRDAERAGKLKGLLEENKAKLDDLYQSVERQLSAAIKTDAEDYARVQRAWRLVKQVIDIAAITLAGTFGGPPAALIVKGVLQVDPWALSSGVLSNTVIGPTELQGKDGRGYWSTTVTPAGMNSSENALFRTHAATEQLAGILGFEADAPGRVGGSLDFGSVAANVEKVAVRSLEEAVARGKLLVAPFVASVLTVPDIYSANFKYFYIAATLEQELLKDFTSSPSVGRQKLREVFRTTADKVLERRLGGEYTHLRGMPNDYPESYSPAQVARIRLHKAGFEKYIEDWSLLYGHTATGSLVGAKRIDLVYAVDPGSNQFKSFFRGINSFFGEQPPKKCASLDSLLKASFEKHTSILNTKSNPLRKLEPNRRAEDSLRVQRRKRLLLSWFIVHKMFELHTGFPIPALLPWGERMPEGAREAFAYAVADVLHLAAVLGSLDDNTASSQEFSLNRYKFHDRLNWKDELPQHYLFAALASTPMVLKRSWDVGELLRAILKKREREADENQDKVKRFYKAFLDLMSLPV